MTPESPYASGVWECLPVPESGPFFREGDRVRTRGFAAREGTVKSVVVTRLPVRGYSMDNRGEWADVETIRVEHDGDMWQGVPLVRNTGIRAQDYDLIERVAQDDAA